LAHTAYSPGVEQSLRQRLQAVGLNHDAITIVVKVGKRTDLPVTLGDQWAIRWDGQILMDLVNLSPADRQHTLARQVDDFLQDPLNREQRAQHAATQTSDPDLRVTGELAVELLDVLAAFGRDVNIPTTSLFTGKVKYATLTDLDLVTTKAIIEVSTQNSASGKVSQLAILLGREANPHGLPVFHYMPNVDPASTSAQSLRAAGSRGVYNDRVALVATIRSLP
jgi:hypothetical protein